VKFQGTKSSPDIPFIKEDLMPYCPKCLHKLTKRKSDNTYNCAYHGFVRKVYSIEMLTQPKEKKK